MLSLAVLPQLVNFFVKIQNKLLIELSISIKDKNEKKDKVSKDYLST